MQTHGSLAGKGDAVHQATLAVVVVDRLVVGGAVVPDSDVAALPIPTNRVLGYRDSVLQQFEHDAGLVVLQAEEVRDESPDEEHLFIGLGVDAHDRMLGAESGAWKIASIVLCCSVRVSGWDAA
jgi:hypothetical protein